MVASTTTCLRLVFQADMLYSPLHHCHHQNHCSCYCWLAVRLFYQLVYWILWEHLV